MKQEDHVDQLLAKIAEVGVAEIDPDVEGIVDRIGGLSRRFHRFLDETLAEVGLDLAEWKALAVMHQAGEPYRSTPSKLAKRMELSSGAVTNRLDRLEQSGLVRRLPDPDDRRGVLVEMTEHGREKSQRAVGVQAKKEELVAAALTTGEKKQLNDLLRRMMLEFERREAKP